MINNATIVGRLTRDVDVRTSASGMAVGRFTLAVDASRKDANGNRHTNFINCVAFGKAAELISQYMKKGSQLGVTGEIRTGSYQNQQGNTVYTTDVVVSEFAFLDSRGSNNGGGQNGGGYQNGGFNSSNSNYNGGQSNNDYNAPSSPADSGFASAPMQDAPAAQPSAPATNNNDNGFNASDHNLSGGFGVETNFEITDDELPF
jgi:single-strand DNA-binding protein